MYRTCLRNVTCLARSRALSTASSIVEIKQTDGAGRGLFAKHPVLAGAVFQRVDPVVAHPTLSSMDTVCYHCLQPRLIPGVPSTESSRFRPEFCGPECEEVAMGSYMCVQNQVKIAPLLDHCRKDDQKFPLLIARLVFLILSRSSKSDALAPLCFANANPPPEQWLHEHSLLRSALEAAGWQHEDIAFCTAEWYCHQMAKLHLNAFRVELVRPFSFNSSEMLQAASAAITGDSSGGYGACGTGVYLVPSFLNHSCDPNVGVEFPDNNSTMVLRARRDIQAGEQLHITYIDASATREVRQKELHWGYGFKCDCARCSEELN
mmetsp:Transcript_25258/g.47756  ORF Transcript_25258/g.47756 Transcript_25258/m.47756 type:complete len:320 (-) Transcript_25258:200-1159(-)